MSDPADAGHPVGPEIDDSQNPTHAAPEGDGPGDPSGGQEPESAERDGTANEMLAQLQVMIDNLAKQAGPVVREVAAKAAELAAVAGERAGPIAHRAAELTERVGERVAVRSKEAALDLRRSAEGEGANVPREDVPNAEVPPQPPEATEAEEAEASS